MASVVASTANGASFITLDKCVAWKITGGYSPPPNKTVILLQLCMDGKPITDIFPLELCQSGEQVEIDFTRAVKKELRTTPPNCVNANSIIKDEKASAKVELKLGEIMINNDMCMEDMDPIDLASQMSVADEVIVVNGFCNPGEESLGDESSLILSNRPHRYVQCFCQKDWVYVYGAFTAQVTAFNKNGNQIIGASWTGSSQGECVSMIPTGPKQLISLLSIQNPEDLAYFNISLNGIEYKVHVRKCCCKPRCKVDIYALEPKGGFSLVAALNCIEEIDTQKTGREICLEESCFGTEAENSRNGYRWLQDSAFAILKTSTEINVKPSQINFMIGVGVSASYAVRLPCTEVITRAAVSNESMKVFSKKGKTPINIPIAYPIQTHSFN